jgi:hypothetical protein
LLSEEERFELWLRLRDSGEESSETKEVSPSRQDSKKRSLYDWVVIATNHVHRFGSASEAAAQYQLLPDSEIPIAEALEETLAAVASVIDPPGPTRKRSDRKLAAKRENRGKTVKSPAHK